MNDTLHVKNSDNSENNASVQVSLGRKVYKLARRISKKPNTFWDALDKFLGVKNIREADFQKYLANIVHTNPNVIHIDKAFKFY